MENEANSFPKASTTDLLICQTHTTEMTARHIGFVSQKRLFCAPPLPTYCGVESRPLSLALAPALAGPTGNPERATVNCCPYVKELNNGPAIITTPAQLAAAVAAFCDV
ncbi:MAG TPA: hypothetical protein VMV72_02925 [Verrucomicrobiae bacterium]|nr:hypothetical protein [Verrucomicrobiae bacterium]